MFRCCSRCRQDKRRSLPRWLFVVPLMLLPGMTGCSFFPTVVVDGRPSNHKSTSDAEEQEADHLAKNIDSGNQDKKPALLEESKQLNISGLDKATPRSIIPITGSELSMDLNKALGFAEIENPTIGLAQEAVQASLALRTQARALWLPTLDVGVNFNSHEGNLQSGRGLILDVNRQALYVGAGAAAIGAGTVGFPGVRLTAHLGDAIYEPRVAEQIVTGRLFDAQATSNNILLEVAERFYALAGAQARLTAIRQSQSDLQEIVKLTADFASTGQGREGDAERSRSEALLLSAQEQHAQEEVAVATAELARLLSMDPSVRLRAPTDTFSIVQLIDPRESLEGLISIAIRNRPEIAARTADIMVVETRLRKERVRPLLPFVQIGFSAGRFGGGSDQADDRFGHFGGRTDFDVLAFWSLQNMGMGNLAIQRALRAQVGQSEAELAQVVHAIRREVTEAYARSAASLRELETARRRVETAQRSFGLDLKRTKNLQGHPIEVLNSMNQLAAARLSLVQATTEFNQAQFGLFVSLGRPPTQAKGE